MVLSNSNLTLPKRESDRIDLLRSILESTSEYAIFAKDLQHRILLWNKGAKEIFGYKGSEIANQSALNVLYNPKEIISGRIDQIFETVKQEGHWSGELECRTKQGHVFTALVNISLRKNSNGKLLGYTLIARDLTELQNVLHVLKKLKESDDLLYIKYKELLEKINEAEAANRLKNEFVANMSHELRTPLHCILGFNAMLSKEKVGPLAPKQKEYLNNICNCANQLLSLINDILDLEKVESGHMEFFPEKIHIQNFLEESIRFFSNAISNKNLNIILDIEPQVSEIFIDALRLKQVFNNFFSNAVKFTNKNGWIQINVLKLKKNNFRLEIKDSGIGIKTEDQARLFKKFQQLNEGKDKQYAGTGLGLALTQKIIESQGGKVGFKSIYGKGSTFYAILPLKQKTKLQLKPLDTSTKTILLIQNKPKYYQNLLEKIRAHQGYLIQSFLNITEILKLHTKLDVDVLIFDLFLKDIYNWRILKNLTAEKRFQQKLNYFLVICEELELCGYIIQEFLIKPIVPENVLYTLHSLGIPPYQNKTILVIDTPDLIRRIKNQLKNLGYNIEGKHVLKKANEALFNNKYDGVIIDLFLNETEGFDFLNKNYKYLNSNKIPIIIWRKEHLEKKDIYHYKNLIKKKLQNESSHQNINTALPQLLVDRKNRENTNE